MKTQLPHPGAAVATRLVLLAAGLAVLLLLHAQFRLALVVGDSMLPGLRTGDLLVLDKRAYRAAAPRRGDVVVARHGRELIVKRVVGLPGEEVALKLGRLYINGLPLAERQPVQPGFLSISPGRLLSSKFALLGDNRDVGVYQAVHAVVAKDQIVGKVIWPRHRSVPPRG